MNYEDAEEELESFLDGDEVSGRTARFALQKFMDELEFSETDEFLEYAGKRQPATQEGVEWCASAIAEGDATLQEVKDSVSNYEPSQGSSGSNLHDRIDDLEEQIGTLQGTVESLRDELRDGEGGTDVSEDDAEPVPGIESEEDGEEGVFGDSLV